MKRPFVADDDLEISDQKMKNPRLEDDVEEGEGSTGATGFTNLDENLLYEVLKHVDARTLATAACVSKLWHRTAQDERLWELICTRHWANIGCGDQQIRSVVLALGGFRRLHSFYWPLSKPQPSSSSSSASASSSSSSWPSTSLSSPFTPHSSLMRAKLPTRWGKDEVHLSLSLLSIRYYEKMNFNNRGR